jgi:hypothetical protein
MTDFIDELIETMNKRDPYGAEVEKAMTFTLTQHHLDLLKRTFIQWDDGAYDGAAAVGLKRPYGNSDMLGDIAEIVVYGPDWRQSIDEDDEHFVYDREGGIKRVIDQEGKVFTRDDLQRLHRETELALQIVLCTQSFVPGVYRKREQYSALSWALEG